MPSPEASMRAIIAVLFGGGLGVLLAVGVAALAPGTSGLLRTAILWSGMAVAVVCALVVQRAPGLFRLRFADVVWGLGGAALLRLIGGVVSNASVAPFPTANDTTASLSSWVVQEGVPAGLIGPVVEEMFFRAVLVVALYRLLSSRLGPATAALRRHWSPRVPSCFCTQRLRLCNYLTRSSCSLWGRVRGSRTSDRRVWGAILLHVTYNASFLLLAVVGSLLA